MASGVKVDDKVKILFENMKTRRSGDIAEEQLKLVLFRISDDGKSIIVDEKGSLQVKDLEGEENVFNKIVSQLPVDTCRYALYDCSYETKDTVKEDLVFIMWAPDTSPIKAKLLYASSKQAIRQVFLGIKFEWQVNDLGDTKDNSVFIDKLGGRGLVKKLEGKEI
ncbi:non-muscle cofilin 1-like [Osmerus eperlanus]|uniref:non-muscle cofilin 1-like n=1 Tax=Osmerus eperlanus TaxID=29151 RepID=UPI002E0E2486